MRSTILTRRSKIRVRRNFDLQLTSLMDMLIIIVVFLLKSYAATSVHLTTSATIKLPQTTSEELPADSSNLIIAPEGITFDDEKVVEFENKESKESYEMNPRLLADGGRRIVPLYDAMIKAKERAQNLIDRASWKDKDGKSIAPPKFHGVVLIQADKTLRYDLLKKIMYTAGAAEFKTFKLAAVQKTQGAF